MKKLLLILPLLFLFGLNVKAQTPTSDEEFDLMQRAQMISEIKKLRSESAVKDEKINGLENQIKLYKQLDEKQESRISDLKEALNHATNVDNISIRIEDIYKSQLMDYKNENQRLRDENAKLRKSRDRTNIISLILGGALGALAF